MNKKPEEESIAETENRKRKAQGHLRQKSYQARQARKKAFLNQTLEPLQDMPNYAPGVAKQRSNQEKSLLQLGHYMAKNGYFPMTARRSKNSTFWGV